MRPLSSLPLRHATLVGPLPELHPPVLPRVVRVFDRTHVVDTIGLTLVTTGCASAFPRGQFKTWFLDGLLSFAAPSFEFPGSPVSCPGCLAWWAEREAEESEVTAFSLPGGAL